MNQSIGYLMSCPNCHKATIPVSYEAGLLADWCDACNKSIFDDSPSSIDPDWAAQQMEDNREL